jgi:hypothetical protein
MVPWNMTFAFFLLDPRPFEELRLALDEMLVGCFVEDLESKADGRLRYTNYVFGLVISCSYEESWEDGKVYRLVGGMMSGIDLIHRMRWIWGSMCFLCSAMQDARSS